MSDILYPLRRIHGALNDRKKEHLEKKRFRLYMRATESTVFVIGTPTHTNIGDSAIALAEIAFLEKCYNNTSPIKEITVPEYQICHKMINKLISPSTRFFGMGGGNMGDQWFHEEEFRRTFIIDQLKNKPVIFPQTIFYSDTQDGKNKEQESIAIYNVPAITLVAREKISFEIMQKLYPRANILLTPDIVLSATMDDFGAVAQERKGILFCVRNDEEKAVSDSVWTELERELTALGKETTHTDMHSNCQVTKENRRECVRKKMQEFCGAELVVTDRLHGMLFAAITETPCVVFGNYNHKVKGTYDWISYLPYIRYVESADEAKAVIPELLEIKNCKYDNTPLLPYFDKLAEVIKFYAQN